MQYKLFFDKTFNIFYSLYILIICKRNLAFIKICSNNICYIKKIIYNLGKKSQNFGNPG